MRHLFLPFALQSEGFFALYTFPLILTDQLSNLVVSERVYYFFTVFHVLDGLSVFFLAFSAFLTRGDIFFATPLGHLKERNTMKTQSREHDASPEAHQRLIKRFCTRPGSCGGKAELC